MSWRVRTRGVRASPPPHHQARIPRTIPNNTNTCAIASQSPQYCACTIWCPAPSSWSSAHWSSRATWCALGVAGAHLGAVAERGADTRKDPPHTTTHTKFRKTIVVVVAVVVWWFIHHSDVLDCVWWPAGHAENQVCESPHSVHCAVIHRLDSPHHEAAAPAQPVWCGAGRGRPVLAVANSHHSVTWENV